MESFQLARRPSADKPSQFPGRNLLAGGDSSDLRVLYKGQDVATDITALQVGLWNAGDSQLDRRMCLSQSSSKLRRLSVSRPVTKFTLDTADIANGNLRVSWRILEHNDCA